MKKEKHFLPTFIGIVLFFFTIAISVTIGIAVYITITEQTQTRGIILLVMLSTIMGLALIATVIDFIRRKTTVDKPVKEILSATNKIASGNFSVHLEITHEYPHYNEFDFIKENLNKMASELAKTEVLHNDFISNVSHELKTPLAIIQNYAASLQKETLDEETRKKYAQTLVSTASKLTALIMNILKLNKLENQELSPEYEKIRLDELLAQVVISFEDLIENKNLVLNCELEEKIFRTCPNYLEIVFNNLLSNAIKFTEPGGNIGISLKYEKNQAIISVSDTGCGISKETGEHIFDKFYQGDTSHAKEGNGLGLALVKKVIDVIGGEISVESQLGVGTTFTIILNEELYE